MSIDKDNYQHCIAKNRLKGKIAVVTASSNGIGFSIVRRLAQEGAKVILSSRKKENVVAAITKLKGEGLNVIGLVCHVSKKEDRDKLFETAKNLGGLDILVSNAAVNPIQRNLTEYQLSVWNKILEVNVTASFLLAKEAHPLLKEKGGSIVFIATAAVYQPIITQQSAYTVSKTALVGLSKALAIELGPQNIRVNCVSPGFITTNFSKIVTDNTELANKVLESTILKKCGNPENVSGVVAFLVSDDAQYITGESIIVAGGLNARL